MIVLDAAGCGQAQPEFPLQLATEAIGLQPSEVWARGRPARKTTGPPWPPV